MTFHPDDVERNVVAEHAARWLTQLADSTLDERDAFVSWLKQSPHHIEEFLLVSATWEAFAGSPSQEHASLQNAASSPHHMKHAAEIERIVAEALAATTSNIVTLGTPSTAPNSALGTPPDTTVTETSSVKQKRGRFWFGAAAAAVLVALALRLVWTPSFDQLLRPDSVQTSVGEQRTVRLVDGSIVYLNARSHIRVAFSRDTRQIELDQGEAVFKVAHDTARPFRVHVGAATVQAVGTEFNVYRHSDETTVSVLEGKVEIQPADVAVSAAGGSPQDMNSSGSGVRSEVAAPVMIAAGEQASITPRAIVKQAEPDMVAAVAWRERRLVFRSARLEDIAAEFGRYSPRRIQLQDDLARDMRITGTFDADDPGSLVLFLEKLQELNVRRDGEAFVVRGRRLTP